MRASDDTAHADQRRRLIRSIDELRQRSGVQALADQYGERELMDALRDAVSELRGRLAGNHHAVGVPETVDDATAWIERRLVESLTSRTRTSLPRVINATGVVLHTNLGRAPLAESAVARLRDASGYVSLEYDLTRGDRGSRHAHAEQLLTRLTGAEAGVVVNNNAAAALLILQALAAGREVIISRGELVEIGGGFRVPEVMRLSGAALREVGTTNRTRVADYAAALNDRTALILRVHPSNFRMEGFTERPALADLAALARRFSVPLVEDIGSGQLERAEGLLEGEPVVRESVEAGADLVCFSGDKLLGGPQAGIIVGRHTEVERLRHHPLMRALRVDKLTYAALEATLLEYAAGRAHETVPVQRMLRETSDAIGRRAQAIAAALSGIDGLNVEVRDGVSVAGGGSAPDDGLPTKLLALSVTGLGAAALAARLRAGVPPLIARVLDDRVVIDLRTVAPAEDVEVINVVRRAVTQQA
jgi:L-seryl-tRNA(Ser) seleniumtransferase